MSISMYVRKIKSTTLNFYRSYLKLLVCVAVLVRKKQPGEFPTV